jgi:hypothetical protein
MSSHSRRDVIIAATALGAAGSSGASAAAQGTSSPSKASLAPIVHHVFFWLKNPDSKADRDALIAGLRTLAGVDTVRGIHIGVPADTAQRGVIDASYNVSEILLFDDVAGQNAYQVHPIHKKFVADCEHLWQRVVVYDVKAVTS